MPFISVMSFMAFMAPIELTGDAIILMVLVLIESCLLHLKQILWKFCDSIQIFYFFCPTVFYNFSSWKLHPTHRLNILALIGKGHKKPVTDLHS